MGFLAKLGFYMETKNMILLLQGRALLQEVDAENEEYRAWVELSLQDELKPAYPFRTEPNAMIGHSPYSNICDESNAKFKIRKSYFLAEDIENDFEPSYDRVGEYVKLGSIDELTIYLKDNGLRLDDFIDASNVDDYPL